MNRLKTKIEEYKKLLKQSNFDSTLEELIASNLNKAIERQEDEHKGMYFFHLQWAAKRIGILNSDLSKTYRSLKVDNDPVDGAYDWTDDYFDKARKLVQLGNQVVGIIYEEIFNQ